MIHAKLQIGCLLVILFINFVYLKATLSKKIPCNKFYDILMFLAPISVFFDGLTAITINYLSFNTLNIILHLCFFLSTELVLFFIYLYMIDKTIGLPKSHLKKILLSIPMAISIILVIAFINKLEFIDGINTNYSMGISVITCYISLIVHFLIVLFLTIYKYKKIEKRKMSLFLTSLLISFVILIIQTIYKEALISSLFPTIMMVGLYLSLEDPSIRRLEIYNGEMVTSFSTLVESRDSSTGGHIKRTKNYVAILVSKMALDKRFSKIMTKDYIKDIIEASPMHDIGKISTPDYILQKPGKLTDEEYAIIKLHAAKGGELIKETFKDIDDKEFIQIAYEEARYHHEKWNGKGYPEGLKEEKIPLHARIMAIADVFDAVSAKRCYRDALPLDVCFKIILDGKGTDFDPVLVDLFLQSKDEIIKIYKENKE